jgi:hypothetical protein
MAIDPHNLPESRAALHQIVLQLLQVAEDKDRCWNACSANWNSCCASVTDRNESGFATCSRASAPTPTTGSMSCFRPPGMPDNQPPSL